MVRASDPRRPRLRSGELQAAVFRPARGGRRQWQPPDDGRRLGVSRAQPPLQGLPNPSSYSHRTLKGNRAMGTAIDMKPALIPDDELRARDNSGGMDWE